MDRKTTLSRRKFLSTLCVAGLGTAGYMRWCEPEWLQVGRHHAMINPKAPPGVGNLHGMRLNCPPEVSLLTVG